MHWWGAQPGMGLGGFGGFLMILFWVLLIIGIVYLVKTMAGSGPAGKEKDVSAGELLKRRFAKGEISKDEFEEAMAVLKKHQE